MNKPETKKKKIPILFCPLDWGLGHIARDFPLIKEFHDKGYKVIVAASPHIIKWVKAELPELTTTSFPGPRITYGKKGFSFLKFILSLPELLKWPFREKSIIQELVKKYHPKIIVSDNRYGARHKDVFSVIITHQLMIKMPGLLKWLEYPVHWFITLLINRFDECWIPDFTEDKSLAGDLVHKYPLPDNSRLIGPLSRFEKNDEKNIFVIPEKSVLAIISGPEPQKSILEKILITAFKRSGDGLTLFNGKTNQRSESPAEKIIIYGHSSSSVMRKEILRHNNIIVRSGYSTIMDMYALGKKCLLVPTPGQTEQEYLAGFHKNRNHLIVNQNTLTQLDTMDLSFPPPDQNGHEALIFREKLKDFF
ncbi:glycosyltransferase [Marinilabilia rubra]|uniref:Glycosyl transferase family 28 n=1 Tax=Marinilabilia rubra TaxID=2162893 RepID=A0A2U2B7X5_9BACT|nr:glycosyltransferase [Marinilabilia rubra]PWD99169.1 glycosyl transferase family 28 [Marinilabilia rubra]